MVLPKKPTKLRALDDLQSQPFFRMEPPLTDGFELHSFYEIDRSQLPSGTPTQLQLSTRVVMVSEMSEKSIKILYPSGKSLERYFGSEDYFEIDPRYRSYPAMDKTCVMGMQLAAQVLVRKISDEEATICQDSKAFWVADHLCSNHLTRPVEVVKPDVLEVKKYRNEVGREGSSYPPNHEKGAMTYCELPLPRKRKRSVCKRQGQLGAAGSKEKVSKAKATAKKNNKGDMGKCRWSTERYEKAKGELFDVLIAKKATAGNPIKRSDLKTEASKRIGDTGLLDHLLFHAVGEVTPDGALRFKRKCNPEKVMLYWLESADLDEIREIAGVHDPYWIPPPGWKLGDHVCTQEDICAAEIKALKEELAKSMMNAGQAAEQEEYSLGDAENLDNYKQNATLLKGKYDELLRKRSVKEKELRKITETLTKIGELMKSRAGL